VSSGVLPDTASEAVESILAKFKEMAKQAHQVINKDYFRSCSISLANHENGNPDFSDLPLYKDVRRNEVRH
jgi:hypothetical protein